MISKTLSLSCNNCGAPLEVPEGTHFLTCTYCSSKLRVECSGTAYYTTILERIEANTRCAAEDLAIVRLQNDLSRLDQEWMMFRERHLIRSESGQLSEPIDPAPSSPLVTAIAAAVILIPGLLFVGLAVVCDAVDSPVVPMVLLGVLTMVFVLCFGHLFDKSAHKRARFFHAYKRRYESIRRSLVNRLAEKRSAGSKPEANRRPDHSKKHASP